MLQLSVRGALLCLLVIAGSAQTVLMARELPPVYESQPLGGQQTVPAVMAAPVNQDAADGDEQSMVEMLIQIETLQQEVQELRGLVEVQNHMVEGLRKRQRDLYVDIDRRLRQLSLPGMTAALPAVTAASPAMNGTAGTAAVGDGVTPPPSPASSAADASVDLAMQEQAAYQQAFNVVKEGRYEDSIEAFNGFLSQYPQGQYAANAQYWIGEANFALRRYEQAAQEFNKVINNYADSSKVADAMLKLGYSYYELGQWDQSRIALTALVGKYADTTSAQLAKNRLHRMKLEGK